MPTTSFLRNHGKTSRTPNRPFEKERMDAEMKLLGEYGLKNKREVWRVQLALAKIRKASRVLLTLDEKDPRRVFEGAAILRRLFRTGVLPEDRLTLDYVLALKAAVSASLRGSCACLARAAPMASDQLAADAAGGVHPRNRSPAHWRLFDASFCCRVAQDFLERRLQTQVFKLGLAKSIHHARVLIKQRHIRVGKQIVNVPQFMVRTDSQKHIDFSLSSPFGGGRPGRVKRKALAAKSGGGGGGDAGEEEDNED